MKTKRDLENNINMVAKNLQMDCMVVDNQVFAVKERVVISLDFFEYAESY